MKRVFLSGLLLLVLITGAAGIWLWQGFKTLEKPVTLAQPVLFEVAPGSSFSGVARQLEQRELLEDSLWLRLWGRLHRDRNLVQAGTYEFTQGDTALTMVDKMVSGDTKTWQVQFIEGWRFRDLRKALAAHDHLTRELTDLSDEDVMARLGHPDQHPEGRFFPDTYVFTGHESDLDILRRAYNRMQSILDEEWAGRADDLPYESAYEALIMASIIEKETGVPRERGQIAGVFVRRLEKGMRLQTDPTVIYGMGDDYDGNITRRNLRTTTPYNTYRIAGLPPTPIALPGQEAIHAALHPEAGDTLYFVARGDGSHVFSRTFREHQNAVRQYQLQRRDDYRSSPSSSEAEPE